MPVRAACSAHAHIRAGAWSVSIAQVKTTPTQKVNLGRVRIDISGFAPSTRRSLFARLHRWYRLSGLRLLLLEGRNLVHRIGSILEIAAWERRGYKAPIPKALNQISIPSFQLHKHAYMLHMQQTESAFPFLSIFDLHLVSQAWKAGLEYGIRTRTEQNQEAQSSLDSL